MSLVWQRRPGLLNGSKDATWAKDKHTYTHTQSYVSKLVNKLLKCNKSLNCPRSPINSVKVKPPHNLPPSSIHFPKLSSTSLHHSFHLFANISPPFSHSYQSLLLTSLLFSTSDSLLKSSVLRFSKSDSPTAIGTQTVRLGLWMKDM